MKRTLLLSILTIFTTCLSASPVEHVMSTNFDGAPAIVTITYDTDDVKRVTLNDDGGFSLENQKLPSSEIRLTDASTGKTLSQYRNVFMDWYRNPLVMGSTDITDIRFTKTFENKSVRIELTIETAHNAPIFPWVASNAYGYIGNMTGDFFNDTQNLDTRVSINYQEQKFMFKYKL